jgi:hypothetical protein
MNRDTQAGKPRYDLIDLPMLKRWAALMERGAAKYGEQNWRLASSDEELTRFKASAFRHMVQWLEGDAEEDHAAAVLFNVAAAEYVRGQENDEPKKVIIQDMTLYRKDGEFPPPDPRVTGYTDHSDMPYLVRHTDGGNRWAWYENSRDEIENFHWQTWDSATNHIDANSLNPIAWDD